MVKNVCCAQSALRSLGLASHERDCCSEMLWMILGGSLAPCSYWIVVVHVTGQSQVQEVYHLLACPRCQRARRVLSSPWNVLQADLELPVAALLSDETYFACSSQPGFQSCLFRLRFVHLCLALCSFVRPPFVVAMPTEFVESAGLNPGDRCSPGGSSHSGSPLPSPAMAAGDVLPAILPTFSPRGCSSHSDCPGASVAVLPRAQTLLGQPLPDPADTNSAMSAELSKLPQRSEPLVWLCPLWRSRFELSRPNS